MRGRRVIPDFKLAELYDVSTARLNQQVRRNIHRFPDDFLFVLNHREHECLMLHFATSKAGRGGRRKLPFAFTEHGAIMAATVLNSRRAVDMSVYVVRAFIRLRELVNSNTELARRFAQLDNRLSSKLAKHDEVIGEILGAIRQIMSAATSKRRGIGFTANLDEP
jgi:ORF6N domain